MFSLSNGLSLLRAPLALLFFSKSMPLRLLAIALAMLSDALDGYLARKRRSTTQFGAILDPTMDKFFAYTAITIFFFENQVQLWQALSMISRDFALCLFGAYLAVSGKWQSYQFRAIRWGKATTALQFLVLILLTLQVNIPAFVFWIFILFAVLALNELYQITLKRTRSAKNAE